MRTASTVGHALANLLMPVLGYIELSGRAPDPRLDDAVTRVAALPALLSGRAREQGPSERERTDVVSLVKQVAQESETRVAVVTPHVSLDVDPVDLAAVVTAVVACARARSSTVAVSVAHVEIDDAESAVHHALAAGSYAAIRVSEGGAALAREERVRFFEVGTDSAPERAFALYRAYHAAREMRAHLCVDSSEDQTVVSLLLPR